MEVTRSGCWLAEQSTVHSSVRPAETFFGTPNELSSDEVSYDLLLDMHRATILPDAAESPNVNVLPLGKVKNNARYCPVPIATRLWAKLCVAADRRWISILEQDRWSAASLSRLDFATRDWRADWRENFQDSATATVQGVDFVSLYFLLRIGLPAARRGYTGGAPTTGRWNYFILGNAERVAAFLSLEADTRGKFVLHHFHDCGPGACCAAVWESRLSICVFRSGGHRATAVCRSDGVALERATGIGAFYDDDVHRYLPASSKRGDSPVNSSLRAAEQATLVMLTLKVSRHVAAQTQNSSEPISQVHANEIETQPRKDPTTLPQQVIYHFAVGRAIPDPRIED